MPTRVSVERLRTLLDDPNMLSYLDNIDAGLAGGDHLPESDPGGSKDLRGVEVRERPPRPMFDHDALTVDDDAFPGDGAHSAVAANAFARPSNPMFHDETPIYHESSMADPAPGLGPLGVGAFLMAMTLVGASAAAFVYHDRVSRIIVQWEQGTTAPASTAPSGSLV